MKLKLNKLKLLNLSLLLTVLLLAVLVYEVYIAYKHMYPNLSVDAEIIKPADVVRVNLSAYQETVGLLDSLKNFEPKALELKRVNPFK